MCKGVTDLREFEMGLDGKLLSQVTFGLGGEDINVFISICKTHMCLVVSLEIGGHSPVADLCGGILNKGVGSRIAGKHVDEPLRQGFDGFVGMMRGGVDVEDGRGAATDVSVT
jgi:hypothetical protein